MRTGCRPEMGVDIIRPAEWRGIEEKTRGARRDVAHRRGALRGARISQSAKAWGDTRSRMRVPPRKSVGGISQNRLRLAASRGPGNALVNRRLTANSVATNLPGYLGAGASLRPQRERGGYAFRMRRLFLRGVVISGGKAQPFVCATKNPCDFRRKGQKPARRSPVSGRCA